MMLAVLLVVLAGEALLDPKMIEREGDKQSPNTIQVFGYRPEVEREDRPGKSLVIRPEDPTRFDTKAQLAREASLALPETGRVTAQGFAVPRIRGQDTRLTEVYVEDLLLQDPYSGLPLVDEIDLRAFGELAVYQGVAPVSLPTLNGIGVMQYRVRPSNVRPTVGVTAGKPYGASAWGLTRGHVGSEEGYESDLRLYARRHVTDGRYDYYSDNGTPYNTDDDTHETRENNHRSSTQFMLYDHARLGPTTKLKFLLLSQESRNGLPVQNANLASLAEQKAESHLVNLHWERALGDKILTLKTSGHEDQRRTVDPSHATLASRDSSGFQSSAASLGASLDFVPRPSFTRLSFDHEESRARVTSDDATSVKVRRATEKLALGSTVLVARVVTFEAKVLALKLDDRFEERHRSTGTQGGSLAAEVRHDLGSVYAQAGKNRRAPSLLEEFGDGGTVLTSSGVEPEKAEHLELGMNAGGLGFAIFQDETRDRITLVPALAGTLRADNIGKTRVRGVEANAEAAFAATRLFASYTLLKPLDLTNENDVRILPFVAERQATAGIEQKVFDLTLREASRYQGRVYRDLANSIVVPSYLVHDLSADTHVALDRVREVAFGLSVLNVTNVQRLAISSPGTAGNDGATSYSDVTGYALPGRQWRLTASVTF